MTLMRRQVTRLCVYAVGVCVCVLCVCVCVCVYSRSLSLPHAYTCKHKQHIHFIGCVTYILFVPLFTPPPAPPPSPPKHIHFIGCVTYILLRYKYDYLPPPPPSPAVYPPRPPPLPPPTHTTSVRILLTCFRRSGAAVIFEKNFVGSGVGQVISGGPVFLYFLLYFCTPLSSRIPAQYTSVI